MSLHVPLTADTRHMVGERELALMKETAILVNTARGGVVDQDALVAALRRGRPAMAALDVTAVEPIDARDELLTLPNVGRHAAHRERERGDAPANGQHGGRQPGRGAGGQPLAQQRKPASLRMTFIAIAQARSYRCCIP